MPELAATGNETLTYLSGAEIVELMPNGELKGINGYGNPYTVSYASDGSMSGVAGKSDEYRDQGKWWVEGDYFCRQYSSWLEGKAACFKVNLNRPGIGFYDDQGNFISGGRFEP